MPSLHLQRCFANSTAVSPHSSPDRTMVDPICRSWARFTPRFKTVLNAPRSSLILVTMTRVGLWIVSSTCIFTSELIIWFFNHSPLFASPPFIYLSTCCNLSYERSTFSLLSAMWSPANSHCREEQQRELATCNWDIRSTQVYHIALIIQTNTRFKCRTEKQ